jgi:primosomal protein N'
VLDRDTARRRGGADAVVDAVRTGAVRCLIGTQMVAKGHDFPGVTAVGVLSADTLLNFPDFRAAEKTFQLLAQVAGRSGRGDAGGTVHVQTFHPEHPAIRRAAAHDADGFARSELEFRRAFFYPPFAELASILVSSPDRERAEAAASSVGAALRGAGDGLRISGPAPAPLERPAGEVALPDPAARGGAPGRARGAGGSRPGPSAGAGADRGGRGPAGFDVGRRCRSRAGDSRMPCSGSGVRVFGATTRDR